MKMIHLGRRLSYRIFCGVFLVAVIPVCLMGYATFKLAENTLVSNAFTHIYTMGQERADRLDNWFQERQSDVRVLSELSSTDEISHSICCMHPLSASSPPAGLLDDILALTRAQSPSYESIHVLTAEGNLLASTNPKSEMLSSLRHLQELESVQKSGGPVLTPVHQHSNKNWYMHLLAPFVVKGGGSAFVMAILDASATLDPILTARSGLGKTGEAYLVNNAGHIITESKYLSRADTQNRTFDTLGIRSALSQNEGTSIYTNYMGREVVGSYLWLPRYRWALLVEMEMGEILLPLSRIRMIIIVTTAAVGLLCVIMAMVMSKRISRPIIEMANASSRMAQGALDQRISYSSSDEIGVLAKSFNSMGERLSVLVDSLRQKEVSLQAAYDDLLRTQEQLVQSEKMAAIGELVASVVHEMRNPLSSVKLNYQIIGRSLGEESDLSEHYKIGLDQISQLEKMFSDLMDYSRPIALELSAFDIEALIDESLVQLDPQLKEQNIRITKNTNGALSRVVADRDKLRQVMVNLLKNAMEATGRDGTIDISVRAVSLDGGLGVMLEISDNGQGISTQDLKRIFQPFFTTKKKGTGLGLSIVKKILDAHGVAIRVSSKEDRGTSVSFLFKDS